MCVTSKERPKREADGCTKAVRKNILVYSLACFPGGRLTLTSLLVLIILTFKDFRKFIFKAIVFLLLLSPLVGTCVR